MWGAKGIKLRVTAEKLGQLVKDLEGTRGLDSFCSGRGIIIDVYAVEKRESAGDDMTPEFIVNLDKHQRSFLEDRMTVQAFADEYGEAK